NIQIIRDGNAHPPNFAKNRTAQRNFVAQASCPLTISSPIPAGVSPKAPTIPLLHHSNTPSFQDPMELNHILLFTAIATSALVVLQAFQPQSPGARARAAVVLIASVLAWLLARPIAGWLSAIVWCALLVVPAFLQNR